VNKPEENMTKPTTETHSVKACLVCGGPRVYYLFSVTGHRVVQCSDCGLVFLNPQPSDEELSRIYDENYFLGSNSDLGRQAASELKRATAKLYLSKIRQYRGPGGGRLLEIGCGDGDFLSVAEEEGWAITGVEYSSTACETVRKRLKKAEIICGELPQAQLADQRFDLCVISDVVEHVRSPLVFLQEIHRLLKPGGVLFIATPSMGSWSARFMKQRWMEFKAEHLTYFDPETLQTALFKSGYHEVVVESGWKILSFDYVKKHFDRYPVPWVTPAFKIAARLLPQKLQLRHQNIVASGIMVFSKKTAVKLQPVLTVIVPAYNEAKTFGPLMDELLKKELPGLTMEIIIVESGSTDGTRDLARNYASHPRVKLIFEDQPRGKGHAVRAGLQAATGDYILIQDADLEYDLADYDALLEPLLAGRHAFVLGSRHGGRNVWKMRQFTGQLGLSLFVNLGHWFFTALVNLLFFQKLRDPFTMFKVFRRDCLYGLDLKCNRFDFDFELLVKLLRKGFKPVELPVNYRSRSFKEGKKVRFLRDPITWIGTIIWLRFLKINPMNVIARTHGATAANTPLPPSQP
jgi:glycosyltransferase involved in cell wall biosynthesis/2-polyprenyl-3-methyl-5-hydroxy-6-metoxy-1,4-benzoquinol methylase